VKFEGLVWRAIPHTGYALDYHHMLIAQGRWNRFRKYGCLYTSLTREGVLEEHRKVMRTSRLDSHSFVPMDMVSLLVTVEPVLDLCSDRSVLETGADPFRLVEDSDEALEYCRSIADWARQDGYRAILSPSAALPGCRNLNIYLSDSPENLSIEAGPDRLPINY
jgi:RES domain-containing protein